MTPPRFDSWNSRETLFGPSPRASGTVAHSASKAAPTHRARRSSAPPARWNPVNRSSTFSPASANADDLFVTMPSDAGAGIGHQPRSGVESISAGDFQRRDRDRDGNAKVELPIVEHEHALAGAAEARCAQAHEDPPRAPGLRPRRQIPAHGCCRAPHLKLRSAANDVDPTSAKPRSVKPVWASAGPARRSTAMQRRRLFNAPAPVHAATRAG